MASFVAHSPISLTSEPHSSSVLLPFTKSIIYFASNSIVISSSQRGYNAELVSFCIIPVLCAHLSAHNFCDYIFRLFTFDWQWVCIFLESCMTQPVSFICYLPVLLGCLGFTAKNLYCQTTHFITFYCIDFLMLHLQHRFMLGVPNFHSALLLVLL